MRGFSYPQFCESVLSDVVYSLKRMYAICKAHSFSDKSSTVKRKRPAVDNILIVRDSS